ncbi:unnamed protein product [Trichobilharzia szidati]|nr:unnamed protein product [Trichobilharzia szidati]
MKITSENSALISGAYRNFNGGWESTFEFKPNNPLVFSDWHCSIFSLNSGSSSSYVLYGLLREKCFNQPLISVCSNNAWIILKTLSSITAVEKNTGTEIYSDITDVTQLASDGDSVYCIRDETLCLLTITKLEGITTIDRPFGFSVKIKSISCGLGFLLCLTFSGQVFSQGIGSRGQLGLGDLSDRTELTLIEALQILTITQISTGHWHSACLTDTGDVYTWGWNEHGQLGHKSLGVKNKLGVISETERQSCVSVLAVPTPVDFPDELPISQISCGGRHTVCLTEDGIVFCFGWNGYGQLGLDSSVEAVDIPVKQSVLTAQQLKSNMTISSVSCGLWSTSLQLNSKD